MTLYGFEDGIGTNALAPAQEDTERHAAHVRKRLGRRADRSRRSCPSLLAVEVAEIHR